MEKFPGQRREAEDGEERKLGKIAENDRKQPVKLCKIRGIDEKKRLKAGRFSCTM